MKIIYIVAAISLASSGVGFAGEVLRMNSGTVRLQDQSESLLNKVFATGVDQAENGLGYFVVQFSSIPAGAEEELKKRGLEVLTYLPDDCYVVRGSQEALAFTKQAIPEIRAVAPYSAEWKVSPELHQNKVYSDKAERLIVSALDTAANFEVFRQLRVLPGVRVLTGSAKDLIIDAPASLVPTIARIEGVEWIQKMPLFVGFDLSVDELDRSPAPVHGYGFTGYESGTKIMNFDAAYSRGFHGEGQIVAVGDTGLDVGAVASIHPDFVGNLFKGYAIGLGSKTWEDPNGHGTHVSGSVLGNGASSDGNIRGGAYQSKLIMMGLWSSILDNLAPGTDFDRLIGTAYRDGARVHTNSWGSPTSMGAYDAYAVKVDEYTWNNPEMLVLFAAGNSGEDKNKDGRIDEGSVSSPGTAKNTLTVGASENEMAEGGIQKTHRELRGGDEKWGAEPIASDTLSNNANGLAAFSSRGPTKDGRIKPEIVAPGTNIVSVKSRHPKAGALWGEFDKNYVFAGGTSMATPLTAGAAAVTRQFLIKEYGHSAPSGALVKAALIHTAYDLYPGQYGKGPAQELPKARPNVHEGFGRVDMDRLTRLGSETQVIDNKTGLGTSEQAAVKVVLGSKGSLRVTLCYTDAPGSAAAAKSLVNDLDVQVVAPNRAVRRLNDHANNTEMLELSNLAAGEYQVVVKGTNVPRGKNGKQPYALLISTAKARR